MINRYQEIVVIAQRKYFGIVVDGHFISPDGFPVNRRIDAARSKHPGRLMRIIKSLPSTKKAQIKRMPEGRLISAQ